MGTQEVLMDYGDRQLPIKVPADAQVVIRKDPPALANPQGEFERAIRQPLGLPLIPEFVGKGSRVTIAFDAPPRSGIPRRLAIAAILKELERCGLAERDVTLICAAGSQRKRTVSELCNNLGPEIFNRFWPHRLLNHDCTKDLVNLGTTELGDTVEYNSAVAQSDALFYLGTVVPVSWGGFTGTGVVIGLASARCIESHHTEVIADHESCHGEPRRMLYMKHKLAIQDQIEKATGKKIFYVDAAVNSRGEVAAVFAGHCPEVLEPQWRTGESFFRAKVDQADVLIMGLPLNEIYGLSHNPLLALTYAAMPFRTWVNKPLIRKGGVVICVAQCNGMINERLRPSDREVMKLFGNCFSAIELVDFKEEFLTRPEFIYRYQHANAFHPAHPLWLFYEDQYLLDYPGKVIFAGDVNPGAIRQIGCTPARNFEEAWQNALEIVGAKPTVTVVPRYFTRDRVQFYVQ